MKNYIEKLNEYIDSLADFKILPPDYPYNHMGATITDAILQAGLNWNKVVKPRLDKLTEQYPEANTTSSFLNTIHKIGINKLINWQDSEKPTRILLFANFLAKEGIEIEADLNTWLQINHNIEKIKKLRGIGNKTLDYIKSLVGIPTAAIDMHLTAFLINAGINVNNYNLAKNIINETADFRSINRTTFDYSIWKYMSDKARGNYHQNTKKINVPCKKGSIGIAPHHSKMQVTSEFDEIWNFVRDQGIISLTTSANTLFDVKAGITTHNKPVISCYQRGKEYARAYKCCWGYYYNCNRTRFGMYAKALDDLYCNLKKDD